MFFYEGQSCPVCHEHFGEQDDIVTCPECGAPHHRDCWKSEGHCHFAADHGTERQWAQGNAASAKPANEHQKNCPNCGKQNPEFAEFCSHCGKDFETEDWSDHADSPNQPPIGQYTPPMQGDFVRFGMPFQDPYGGVPRHEHIEEFTVDEIAQVVGPNSAYYLPRFYNMTHGGSKLSWNWMSFLLPYNWLLYRKNILWGILSFLFFTATTVLNDTLFAHLNFPTNAATPEALVAAVEQLLARPEAQIVIWICLLLSLLVLAVRVLIGMFGNYLYLKTVLRKAKKLKENPTDAYGQNPLTTGGVSFALAVLPEMLSLFAYYILFLFM